MRSMRGRLLFGLLLGLIILLAVSGTFFYLYMRTVLERQFEAALAAKADALCSLVKWQSNGELELELSQDRSSHRGLHGSFEYFQFWREDGTVVARSPALGKNNLPYSGADNSRFEPIVLPNGNPGKVLIRRFVPRDEDEDRADGRNARAQTAASADRSITLAVAQDRVELDRIMAVLFSGSLLLAAFLAVGTILVVGVSVRQGLKPLERVAREADRIDERSLHVRFSAEDLPAELQPICRRLNDSLERLEKAFQRERRFTADVAHELRTPIAELRTLAEVALKWENDPENSAAFFRDTRDIARQMEGIVSALLSLVRCQSQSVPILREPVDAGKLIEEAWQACATRAAERKLTASFDLPASLVLETERTLLHSILVNLFTNAVNYSPLGGTITCLARHDHLGIRIGISNETDALDLEDLPHLFEPFWRKDPARTDGSHCGLGLTLVDAYAKILGGKVAAQMPGEKSIRLTLDLPLKNPPDSIRGGQTHD